MKQVVPWFISVGCVGVMVGMIIRSPDAQAPPAAAPLAVGQITQAALAPGANPTLAGGSVVHTFEDDAQMSEFTTFWHQGQTIRARMAVLESYWTDEEGSLVALRSRLASQFNLDPEKNYTLDSEARVLREVGLTEGAEGEAAEAGEGAIAHSFADEEGVGAFVTLQQEQQAIRLRMMLLQAYWGQEQTRLVQVDGRLADDYGMDTTKHYTLDRQRRSLIELPTPPAPAQASTPQPS